MNRRAFVLALFGGVAGIEMGSAADLAIPTRMPPPDPLPNPQLWQRPYMYLFFNESIFDQGWTRPQSLEIKRDFFLTGIRWHAPEGAIAELHSADLMLCRAFLNPVHLHSYRLITPLLMPAGESFVLTLKNADGNLGRHEASLVLEGFHVLTDAEVLATRA